MTMVNSGLKALIYFDKNKKINFFLNFSDDNADNFFAKSMENEGFLKFEIIINVLVSYFLFT